jgi:gentisate 1,2-dioxygenase
MIFLITGVTGRKVKQGKQKECHHDDFFVTPSVFCHAKNNESGKYCDCSFFDA